MHHHGQCMYFHRLNLRLHAWKAMSLLHVVALFWVHSIHYYLLWCHGLTSLISNKISVYWTYFYLVSDHSTCKKITLYMSKSSCQLPALDRKNEILCCQLILMKTAIYHLPSCNKNVTSWWQSLSSGYFHVTPINHRRTGTTQSGTIYPTLNELRSNKLYYNSHFTRLKTHRTSKHHKIMKWQVLLDRLLSNL